MSKLPNTVVVPVAVLLLAACGETVVPTSPEAHDLSVRAAAVSQSDADSASSTGAVGNGYASGSGTFLNSITTTSAGGTTEEGDERGVQTLGSGG